MPAGRGLRGDPGARDDAFREPEVVAGPRSSWSQAGPADKPRPSQEDGRQPRLPAQ